MCPLFKTLGYATVQHRCVRVPACVIPRPHLHVKVRPVTPREDNFREFEWDVAFPWQLQGLDDCLLGLYIIMCGCYRVYTPTFSPAKIALRGSYGTALREGVTAALHQLITPHY